MTPKYQIFVSSTYEDLKEERDQIIKATLEMGHIPVGMEMFNAGDEDQWATIKRTIDQCDYYAIIVGRRYGSFDMNANPAIRVSYTEMEYDYARSIGVPVMGFVLDSNIAWPPSKSDNDNDPVIRAEKQDKLANFLNTKVKGRMVNYGKNSDDLQARFMASLSKIIVSNPRHGWVPATQAASPEMATEFARLSKENADLKEKLSNVAQTQQSLAFASEFEMNFYISWDNWPIYSQTGDREKTQNGYRLHALLFNSGNLMAENVKAKIRFPMMLLDAGFAMKKTGIVENGFYEHTVSLLPHEASDTPIYTTSPSPLLVGESRDFKFEISKDFLDYHPQDAIIEYFIYPLQGSFKQGKVLFSDIKVLGHSPERTS